MEEQVIDEDCSIEAVFLIKASTKDVFFNRLRKIQMTSGFYGGSDAFEEDEEGGIWKVIMLGGFETTQEVKESITILDKYSWLFISDSSVMIGGKYFYCNGKYI
jgi:hypothetical protein